MSFEISTSRWKNKNGLRPDKKYLVPMDPGNRSFDDTHTDSTLIHIIFRYHNYKMIIDPRLVITYRIMPNNKILYFLDLYVTS